MLRIEKWRAKGDWFDLSDLLFVAFLLEHVREQVNHLFCETATQVRGHPRVGVAPRNVVRDVEVVLLARSRVVLRVRFRAI